MEETYQFFHKRNTYFMYDTGTQICFLEASCDKNNEYERDLRIVPK